MERLLADFFSMLGQEGEIIPILQKQRAKHPGKRQPVAGPQQPREAGRHSTGAPGTQSPGST